MLCSYFFSTTELNQLLKIPVLISHFVEHNVHDDMGLWEYLSHHYGGHEKDADWDTDMKLPFMQHSDLLHFTLVTPKNTFTLHPKRVYLSYKREFSCYQEQYIPSAYLASIWQPPRFC